MLAAYLHVMVESLKTAYFFAESIILVCEEVSESAGTLQLAVKMHGQGKAVATHCPTSRGLIIQNLVKLSDDWAQLNTKKGKRTCKKLHIKQPEWDWVLICHFTAATQQKITNSQT